MGFKSYTTFSFGLNIGITRVEALLNASSAWNNLENSKQFAKVLKDEEIMNSNTYEVLLEVKKSINIPGYGLVKRSLTELHKWLEDNSEGLGILTPPYGNFYYLGLWIGFAERHAYYSHYNSLRYLALRNLQGYISKVRESSIYIKNISENADYNQIRETRQNWSSMLLESHEGTKKSENREELFIMR